MKPALDTQYVSGAQLIYGVHTRGRSRLVDMHLLQELHQRVELIVLPARSVSF